MGTRVKDQTTVKTTLTRGDFFIGDRTGDATAFVILIEKLFSGLPKLDTVTFQSDTDSATFFVLKDTGGNTLFKFDTIADLLTITGEQLITGKLDVGAPGAAGGLDVGEAGSTQLNLVAYTYDASASSGSRFTQISNLDASNTLLGDVGDRLYLGVQSRVFWGARFDVGVASSAESQMTVKFWDGSALVPTKHMGINKASAVRTGSTIMESVITEYVVWDRHVRDDWVAVDDETDAIPNTGVTRYWIAIEVGGTNLVTPPRVDEIKVRGSDFDVVSGDPPHVVFWGRSRFLRTFPVPAAALKRQGSNAPSLVDVAITSDLDLPAQRFGNSDRLPFSFVIPDTVDTSCPLDISVAYSSNDSGGIDVELKFKILTNGTTIGSGQSGSTTVTRTITPSAADAFQNAEDITGATTHIDISTATPGDKIVFEISRDAADVNTGNFDLYQINIEYVSWQLGGPA